MEELEKELRYTFRSPELLRRALCHSSYANEHRHEREESNERLEFLGDSVLGFVTADYLYARHPNLPEGDLTRRRAALVREETLYEVAKKLELGRYLRLGHGEETSGGRMRHSILADATEALFAAVYLDGGMESASTLIHRLLLDGTQEAVTEERRTDYKTTLQELIQQSAGQDLCYRILDETGPDHAKTFTAEALVNGRPLGRGTGPSKQKAEQAAARAALEQMRREKDGSPS